MSHHTKSLKVMRARSARSGQAMVEYVVIAGILLATFAIFYLFQGTFKEFGARVLSLIGSEYP